MSSTQLLGMYLDALHKAFEYDYVNDGYHVRGPEEYIDDSLQGDIELLLSNESMYTSFFEKIAYYFDAKSHGFDKVGFIPIDLYKDDLIKIAARIRQELV